MLLAQDPRLATSVEFNRIDYFFQLYAGARTHNEKDILKNIFGLKDEQIQAFGDEPLWNVGRYLLKKAVVYPKKEGAMLEFKAYYILPMQGKKFIDHYRLKAPDTYSDEILLEVTGSYKKDGDIASIDSWRLSVYAQISIDSAIEQQAESAINNN